MKSLFIYLIIKASWKREEAEKREYKKKAHNFWRVDVPRVFIDQFAPLGFNKIRQHVLVTPAWIIQRPGIVVARRTPRIDHKVHHGGTADRFAGHYVATAVNHRQAVSTLAIRVLHSWLAPVHAGIVRDMKDRREKRNIREKALVVALLEHQDPPVGILGQAIREHGSRRAGTDHQEIEGKGVIGCLVLRYFRRRRKAWEEVTNRLENTRWQDSTGVSQEQDRRAEFEHRDAAFLYRARIEPSLLIFFSKHMRRCISFPNFDTSLVFQSLP